MKKSISAAAVILAFGATLAFAGAGEGRFEGKRGKGHHMERLATELNLSDAQKQQLAELREGFRAEMEPIHQSFRNTMREMKAARDAGDETRAAAIRETLEANKAQMKAFRDRQHEAFAAILTPEQRTKLEAMRAERGERRGNWKEHGRKHRGADNQ